MTKNRKILVEKLLSGYYLLPWKKHNSGKKCYRLYDANGTPKENINEKTIRTLDRFITSVNIWKTDKQGKITLNLSSVRQLHGSHSIKKLYKQLKEQK